MSDERMRLLHEGEVREALAGRDDLEVYRYRMNKPVVAVAAVVALLLFGLAALLVWNEGLAGWQWIATFVWLVSGGVTAVGLCGYWYAFARSRLIGVGPEALYVGREQRAWAIDWELLDAETLGLERMEVSSGRGQLDLTVGGQKIRLHFYNAFVRLEDLQELMYVLLQRVDDDWEGKEDGDEGSPDEESER
ncbi:MAG: hypothetical protein ABEL76_08235 [Bradymonadaceae bacterium]